MSFRIMVYGNDIYTQNFYVKHKARYVRIDVSDVLWIQAGSSSIEIVCKYDRIVSYAGLKSLLEQINYDGFKRIHRSYIINIDAVAAFDDNHLYVSYEDEMKALPVGRKYSKSIYDHFTVLKTT